jgi:hypothetical protein
MKRWKKREKRKKKKEEILERIFTFNWVEDVNPSLSAENEAIIPARLALANPADTLADTNMNAALSEHRG